MTAVVGFLNKRGVAIAADSAVTRSRGMDQKCTNNGSKMLRMSNVVPISVMLTGNGNYIGNHWEVVVRSYRKKRGDIKHATVEACVHDFFDYIAKTNVFWDEDWVYQWVEYELRNLFDFVNNQIPWEASQKKKDGSFLRPKAYLHAFIKELNKLEKYLSKKGISPQFKDYTLEQFVEYAKPVIDECFKDITESDEFKFNATYSKELLDSIRPALEKTLMMSLISRSGRKGHAELVFSGYGEEQEYPSLVSAIVYEGIDHKVNYHIRPEDVICISDELPAAICPFAQADVTEAIICGAHENWLGRILRYTKEKYNNAEYDIFTQENDEIDFEFLSMLEEVRTDDLIKLFCKSINRQLDKNKKEWVKTLEHYDLNAMAALAQSLIDLTGFHRILTFEQEGVGGPVDVAVITKNDGFTWLSRKSWYHHKDLNGMYGSLGV